MIASQDGRDNVEDWFFLENLKRTNVNDPESSNDGHQQTEHDNTTRKRTKDFIENELHAMSTLSLYDGSLDKMRLTGDADKWVSIAQTDELTCNNQPVPVNCPKLNQKASRPDRLCM